MVASVGSNDSALSREIPYMPLLLYMYSFPPSFGRTIFSGRSISSNSPQAGAIKLRRSNAGIMMRDIFFMGGRM